MGPTAAATLQRRLTRGSEGEKTIKMYNTQVGDVGKATNFIRPQALEAGIE